MLGEGRIDTATLALRDSHSSNHSNVPTHTIITAMCQHTIGEGNVLCTVLYSQYTTIYTCILTLSLVTLFLTFSDLFVKCISTDCCNDILRNCG